jgi:ribosomal 50S subunit-associated protein YjgA (DUF615 family)
MSRSPKPSSPLEPLEHEFAQERATALGRLGRALEAAIATLDAFDSSHPNQVAATTDERQQRVVLVAQASVALWQFVVQRESCGLRDMRLVLRDYRVPAEVAAQMGVLPEPALRPRRRR